MPMLLLPLISALCAYIIFCDAQARNMNAHGWGLFILLSTMLGLPVYFLMRKPRRA